MQTHIHTERHHEHTESSSAAIMYSTLYFDDVQPDCRDKVRVCLFFWNWGSGLAIFNLPRNVEQIVLEYLPSWKVKHRNDGLSCDDGMVYAPSVRFPLGHEYQSGLQISTNRGESCTRVRRRMRRTMESQERGALTRHCPFPLGQYI